MCAACTHARTATTARVWRQARLRLSPLSRSLSRSLSLLLRPATPTPWQPSHNVQEPYVSPTAVLSSTAMRGVGRSLRLLAAGLSDELRRLVAESRLGRALGLPAALPPVYVRLVAPMSDPRALALLPLQVCAQDLCTCMQHEREIERRRVPGGIVVCSLCALRQGPTRHHRSAPRHTPMQHRASTLARRWQQLTPSHIHFSTRTGQRDVAEERGGAAAPPGRLAEQGAPALLLLLLLHCCCIASCCQRLLLGSALATLTLLPATQVLARVVLEALGYNPAKHMRRITGAGCGVLGVLVAPRSCVAATGVHHARTPPPHMHARARAHACLTAGWRAASRCMPPAACRPGPWRRWRSARVLSHRLAGPPVPRVGRDGGRAARRLPRRPLRHPGARARTRTTVCCNARARPLHACSPRGPCRLCMCLPTC